MSQQCPVPRLDLAPKLKRPLSLWNPLDYLRLLYWVFFFPQALRWYFDRFGGRYIPDQNSSWHQLIIWWMYFSLRLSLFALLLPFRLLRAIGVSPAWGSWVWGAGLCIAVVTQGDVKSNAAGDMMGVGVTLSLLLTLMEDTALDVALGLVLGVALGTALSVAFDVTFSVSGSVAFSLAILRPEVWLLSLPLALKAPRNRSWQIPHVTLLPIPFLSSRLKIWLRQDWKTALYNTDELLAYTLQSIPVIQAVNQVLIETPPEQVISRAAQLSEASYTLRSVCIPSRKPRLDIPAYFAATGFWYLYTKRPAKATEAFARVRPLLYGEEMFTLAQTLAAFQEAKEPARIAALQISASPPEPLLRPTTWQAITSLSRVIEDVRLVQRSLSKSTRSFALNRALGELKTTLNNTDSLPNAERDLLVTIAKTWQEALLNLAGEVGEISITKPVANPYVVGDPVQGNLFVGREDILRQLEELWVMGHQLQSVVLYGHRRMGKTSILRNSANCLGSEVKVAYINLLNMGATSQGVGEVLMAISDAISDVVGCTPPTDADLLNLPYRTFERYLKQVEAHLSGGLIVALDEFEKIEELIEAEKIPKDFMGYLRGLVQMSSKVAFAFAGLHTLEEMTADYFQPFFASVIPIHVGFLQPAATRQILANPTDDDSSLSSPRGGGIEGGEFPLDYTPDALDQIYALTAGQPYLVQLVGFQLVRRYNDFVFEQGRPRDPVFTVEDVEAVINDSEFFKRGRYYFDGVWGQAARGASEQQAILKALAPHPQGLSIEELRTRLEDFVGAQCLAPLQEETFQDALKTLTRHDVIQEREGRWQIIVELFRRWVLQN